MANTLILKKLKYFSNKQHLHTKKIGKQSDAKETGVSFKQQSSNTL
jgi:hypothetical protein